MPYQRKREKLPQLSQISEGRERVSGGAEKRVVRDLFIVVLDVGLGVGDDVPARLPWGLSLIVVIEELKLPFVPSVAKEKQWELGQQLPWYLNFLSYYYFLIIRSYKY